MLAEVSVGDGAVSSLGLSVFGGVGVCGRDVSVYRDPSEIDRDAGKGWSCGQVMRASEWNVCLPLLFASYPFRLAGAYILVPPHFWSVPFDCSLRYALPFVYYARCVYRLGGVGSCP